MYKMFLEMDVSEHPKFAAQDLGNLPTLSMNNLEIGKLLKDIDCLKSQVALLADSQSEIVALMHTEKVNSVT
jgi:hypothetical protein